MQIAGARERNPKSGASANSATFARDCIVNVFAAAAPRSVATVVGQFGWRRFLARAKPARSGEPGASATRFASLPLLELANELFWDSSSGEDSSEPSVL